MKKQRDASLILNSDYLGFIEELKARVVSARVTAARAITHEAILLYWDIGRGIVERQQELGWGDSVVEMLALDLQRAFPGAKGFSLANIWRMRQFYLAHNEPEFLAQVARELKNPPSGPQPFLLELGYGFCFVGRQHRIALGKKEYFIDLLFYHRFLKALVAFDLKVGPFQPEFAGKMDFYLNLLNDKERGPEDQPSIGIILCAEKDDVEVEYALRSKANPIGVAAYQLQSKLPGELKGKLPTAKQLADIVRVEMEGGK